MEICCYLTNLLYRYHYISLSSVVSYECLCCVVLMQKFLLTAKEASVVPTYHHVVHLPFTLLAQCSAKVRCLDAGPVHAGSCDVHLIKSVTVITDVGVGQLPAVDGLTSVPS